MLSILSSKIDKCFHDLHKVNKLIEGDVVEGQRDLNDSLSLLDQELYHRCICLAVSEEYKPQEHIQIFCGMCSRAGYQISNDTRELLGTILTNNYEKRDQDFANAREVHNQFEAAVTNQANRLFGLSNHIIEELRLLTIEDIQPLVS